MNNEQVKFYFGKIGNPANFLRSAKEQRPKLFANFVFGVQTLIGFIKSIDEKENGDAGVIDCIIRGKEVNFFFAQACVNGVNRRMSQPLT